MKQKIITLKRTITDNFREMVTIQPKIVIKGHIQKSTEPK